MEKKKLHNARDKHGKIFLVENIFRENDFFENVFR
jgi:hypothetical protein